MRQSCGNSIRFQFGNQMLDHQSEHDHDGHQRYNGAPAQYSLAKRQALWVDLFLVQIILWSQQRFFLVL